MAYTALTPRDGDFVTEFRMDSQVVGEQTERFLDLVYPSYRVNGQNLESYLDPSGDVRLAGMTFFHIRSCSADRSDADKDFRDIHTRFEKLFTALHAIRVPVAYGVVSRNGVTRLVLGVYADTDVQPVKAITQGMLSGLELEELESPFRTHSQRSLSHGLLTGVPSLCVKGEKQPFSLSSIMRSLNGQNYSLLFLAKPVENHDISQDIASLVSVRDNAFAVSKRNFARSQNSSETTTTNQSDTTTQSPRGSSIGGGIGGILGTAAGALIGTFVGGVGAGAGARLGGMLGNGLGSLIGGIADGGESHSTSYSSSISQAISDGQTVSGDIQNGYALELMQYAENAIERLKAGRNNGMWQTAIVYSAENASARDIIRACLQGELSRPDAEKLPMLAFAPRSYGNETMRIPDFLGSTRKNPLCACLNSAELGQLCTVPTESVPDFELRVERRFPMVASRRENDSIPVGYATDGKRALQNMPFGLTAGDLNKHTFVCGITGSGKTTTVKKLLVEAKKPFLVIESAKKEYRNLTQTPTVYTLGKPELHAPKLNPFYIMPGVSPQLHIDYLKDLFNAAFSLFPPLPYILEKCLHTVYENKGWDLTLGYHPLLVDQRTPGGFFSHDYTRRQYAKDAHRYLFPTMQELLTEIKRYMEEELQYEGETSGNLKTAIQVRLENLCLGAKGYSFNTTAFPDFDALMHDNVVFELEGLADDSDKAFSLGLLLVFINEYRQVEKELRGSEKIGLQHLLVIEEAHRLLKNVSTETASSEEANPKGKAVEHFTNMIAEMRSYGQGVIVAEQIPTKLAPDVIKNSSNKLVHRIVSRDDQQVIANTIGISEGDAIQLGTLETGYAYCHKEGMALPTMVQVAGYQTTAVGGSKPLDSFVGDEELYSIHDDRFDEINLSRIRSHFGESEEWKQEIVCFLNTLLVEKVDRGVFACAKLLKDLKDRMEEADLKWILTKNDTRVMAKYLTERILMWMTRGAYAVEGLPDDTFCAQLEQVLYAPDASGVRKLKQLLEVVYWEDIFKFGEKLILFEARRKWEKEKDVAAMIRGSFIDENVPYDLITALVQEFFNPGTMDEEQIQALKGEDTTCQYTKKSQ